MEEQKKVYFQLAKSRVELQNKKIKKSGKNKYAGFNYYDLADLLPHINEVFLENKLISEFSINQNVAYLKIFSTEDCSFIIFSVPTNMEHGEMKMGQDKQSLGMQPVQRLGSVITYVKRYLYINALEIVESDTLDTLDIRPKVEIPKKEIPKKDVSNSQKNLKNLLDFYGYDNPKKMDFYKELDISKNSTDLEINNAITLLKNRNK